MCKTVYIYTLKLQYTLQYEKLKYKVSISKNPSILFQEQSFLLKHSSTGQFQLAKDV